MGWPKEKGSDGNFLRKNRNWLKLAPMNNPALPHGLDRYLPPLKRGGSRKEKISALYPA
jgi:hypothetical protein